MEFDLESISPADLEAAYLHRTARDFLESRQVKGILFRASGSTFNPHITMMLSSLLILKTSSVNRLSRSQIWDLVNQCMENAVKAERSTIEPQNEILQDVDQTAAAVLTFAGLHDTSVSLPDPSLTILLEYWAIIVELFIQHDADPRVSRDSPWRFLIREALGALLSERAAQVEILLKRVEMSPDHPPVYHLEKSHSPLGLPCMRENQRDKKNRRRSPF